MSDVFEFEPIHFEGVMDYHVHCDYSIDAVGTIDEYCQARSEEHTSELQSHSFISYAVFCLKKKMKKNNEKLLKTLISIALPSV